MAGSDLSCDPMQGGAGSVLFEISLKLRRGAVPAATSLVGLLIMMTGCAGLGAELYEHRTLHAFNGSVGVGLVVFGALLIAPAEGGTALKAVMGAVKDLLPWRRNDTYTYRRPTTPASGSLSNPAT